MGLSLREGDYVPDGTGGLRRTGGQEALLERVLFRLTARRGSFPFLSWGAGCGNWGSYLPSSGRAQRSSTWRRLWRRSRN